MSDPNEVTWQSQPAPFILFVVIPVLVILAQIEPVVAAPCLSLSAVSLIVWGTPHRFDATPGKFVVGLLAVEGVLLLSQRSAWFGINLAKGWTALIALECVGAWLLFLLSWFITSSIRGWRFQFSLQSLLALVVAVAVPFSWLAVERERARMQREAVDGVIRLGGDVSMNQRGLAWMPEWPESLLGEDFFCDVVQLRYANATLRSGVFERVKAIKTLRALRLLGPQITDDDLVELEGMTRLTELEFDATRVTDAGLRHLRVLENLGFLSLHASPVTGEGLPQLKCLRNLLALNLSGTNVTDAELEHLSELTNLRWLSLLGTKVTAAGVERLRGTLRDCTIEWEPPSQPVPTGTSGRPPTP